MTEAFSSSYEEARSKFIEAARAAGLQVDSRVHPHRGRDGEEIAMDIVLEGDPAAESLLLLSSGCHGVEGFCGSGVQVSALRDPPWHEAVRASGVAVLYVHALNPHGFSHWRRTTQENVDLNRNFHDFSRPLPDNPGYRELHALLVPEEWPPTQENQQAIAQFIATRGEQALNAAVSRGQHEFADGLFYGGVAPSWSNRTLRDVLRTYGSQARRIGWIDFHTGLGPEGVGERIFSARDDAAALALARQWWEREGTSQVTSIYDGSSTSAFLTGLMFNSVYEECPQAQYTGIALEYGTLPGLQVLQSLRADQWLQSHPQAPRELAESIKRQIRDAFYVDTPQWKQQVLRQAQDAMTQGLQGLAATD